MRYIITLLVFALVICKATGTKAQDTASFKHQPYSVPAAKRYLTGALSSGDSIMVMQIKSIQVQYKKDIRQLMLDSGLTDIQRRDRIDLLLKAKNEKLRRLIPSEQRKQLIPEIADFDPVTGGTPKGNAQKPTKH